jgi:hypothetical protein
MRALKRLERMGQATEEFCLILSMLVKQEQIVPSSAVKKSLKSPPDDSEKEEAPKRVSKTRATTNADLLISEVSELLRKTTRKKKRSKGDKKQIPIDSNPRAKKEPRSGEERIVTESATNDAEDKSDSNPDNDFWISLANQKIRI